MRPMNVRLAVGLAALCVAAPLAAQAKRQPRAKPESAAKDTATRTDSARATTLSREVYAYEGGGRDPFLSLLKSGDIRPLLSDLKLVGIYYDSRYPARSVAVLRDVTNTKIYRVKPADIIGRLKVTTIRPREIVFTVQEFGFERQETLTLEAEFLHRKHDFPRADRRDLEAPDDVRRLYPVDLGVRDVAQHGHAARRIARVVVDADELQVRQERPDVARLEQRQEGIAPAALVGVHLARQRRRARAVGPGRRVLGGALRLGPRLSLRLGRERRGHAQRREADRESNVHRSHCRPAARSPPSWARAAAPRT